jgi:drug/metabolite transporter (DMT)-like permease
MVALGFVAAVLSAVLSSVATLVQARGARDMGHRRARVWYVGGLALDLVGWAMSAYALRYLPVFAVQAIVASQVALTVIGAHVLSTARAGRYQLAAAAACVAGLGVVAASGSTGDAPVDASVVDTVLVVALAAMAIAIPVAVRTGSPDGRAAIAGLAFGCVAVAVRSLHQRLDELSELVRQPAAYAIPVFAAIGAVMFALALRRGGASAVAAIVVGLEMLAAGALGMALLGDGIRPGWQAPCAIGVLVAVAALGALARTGDRVGWHAGSHGP